MINIIQAEYIKYKRTFTRKLIIIMPLVAVMMALTVPRQFFVQEACNFLAVIFIPIGIALLGALAGMQEKKAGNYRNLLVHNISPSRIWIGKIIVMSIHTLLSILVLIVLETIIVSTVLHNIYQGVPWAKIFESGGILWLTSLAIIPLQIWAATWKGIFGSMALGFLGLIVGTAAASKSYWITVPWSYATRLICPIWSIGPNAEALNAGDPLLNASVIPIGIIMSIIALVLFTFITALWFNKREVS